MPSLSPDDRLRAAMLESVNQHGYTGTTISELARLASVSKTTFYTHYATKEACFLATLDEIVDVVSKETGNAYRAGAKQGLRAGLRSSAAEFARLVLERPEAARLVLIDSLMLGATAVPQMERASRHFEAMLRKSFEQEPERGTISELEVRAVVGGMRRMVYRNLRAETPERIAEELEILLDWALQYQRPHRRTELPELVPVPGDSEAGSGGERPPVLPWDTAPDSPVARKNLSQRERMMRAAAIVATSRGYSALSIPAITGTARVSNQTFYQHFESKLDAFLSAFEAMERENLVIALQAFQAQPTWTGGIQAGLTVLADNIVANPVYARVAFFELLAAGPQALVRADEAMDNYTLFLRPEQAADAGPHQPPTVVIDAIGGGIWSIIQHEIAMGRGGSVPEIVPDLTDIVLVPFGVEHG